MGRCAATRKAVVKNTGAIRGIPKKSRIVKARGDYGQRERDKRGGGSPTPDAHHMVAQRSNQRKEKGRAKRGIMAEGGGQVKKDHHNDAKKGSEDGDGAELKYFSEKAGVTISKKNLEKTKKTAERAVQVQGRAAGAS